MSGRYLPALRTRTFYQSSAVLIALPVTAQAVLFTWLCRQLGADCPAPADVAIVIGAWVLAVVAAHLRVHASLASLRSRAARISREEGPADSVDRAIRGLLGAPARMLLVHVPLALLVLVPLASLARGIDARLVEPMLVLPACLVVMLVPPYVQRGLWEIHRLVQFLPPISKPSVLTGHLSTRSLMGAAMILFPTGFAFVEVYNASHVVLLAQTGTVLNIALHVDPLPFVACLLVLAGLTILAWRTGQHAGLMLERISRTFEDAFRPRGPGGEQALPGLARSPLREVSDLQATAETFGARLNEIRLAQRKIIEGLEAAQRVKTVFLANMSHDLKSPLNSVIGFSELLMRGIEGELTQGQKDDISLIHASGEELLNLINNILDSARLEAGKLELHPEWTPSVELISNVVRTGMQKIGTKRIEFDSEIQPGLPPVFVDPHRISQAIGNLISNAIKFMEQGKVTVRAYVHKTPGRHPGRLLRIDVEDTGSGIREEDRDRIFEAFQQIDRSYSRRSSGMGLGLTLTKKLVDLHSGTLMLTSEVGKGSTFSINLPLEE